MTPSQRRTWICSALLVALFSGSEGCAFVSSGTTSRIVPVSVEEKENGFLLELPPGNGVPQVETIVTQRRWVIITIVDPLYDTDPVERFSSPHVDSLDVARFSSAVQLSFRFRKIVTEAHAVPAAEGDPILISVFTR